MAGGNLHATVTSFPFILDREIFLPSKTKIIIITDGKEKV